MYYFLIALLLLILAWPLGSKLKHTLRKKHADRNLAQAQQVMRQTQQAPTLVLGRDLPFRSILWEEPNRGNTPAQHIGQSGSRTTTLTGVDWINETRFVVNHRNGFRMALFDVAGGPKQLGKVSLPELTDDIAVRPMGDDQYDIAFSGCWEAHSCRLTMTLKPGEEPMFSDVSTRPTPNRTFSHGVFFAPSGQLCTAFQTGNDPRIEIGDQTYRLPRPWGARGICHDAKNDRFLIVGGSNTPKLQAYDASVTAVWSLSKGDDTPRMLAALDDHQVDLIAVHNDEIWLPDQLQDHIVVLNSDGTQVVRVIKGDTISFPHGISISPAGHLAMSNYGNSTVTLIDLNDLPAPAA